MLLLLFLGSLSFTATAEVYKWTDAQGQVHFSDKKPKQHKAETVTIKVNSYDHVTYTTLSRPRPTATTGGKNVVLYGTSWCGYCKKAKRYFEANGIAYTDLDVETNEQAKMEFEAMGGGGVPVILVGNKRMNGFSEEGFRQIYR